MIYYINKILYSIYLYRYDVLKQACSYNGSLQPTNKINRSQRVHNSEASSKRLLLLSIDLEYYNKIPKKLNNKEE